MAASSCWEVIWSISTPPHLGFHLFLFLSSPGWGFFCFHQTEGIRWLFLERRVRQKSPVKEAFGRRREGIIIAVSLGAAHWETKKRKTHSLFLTPFDIQEGRKLQSELKGKEGKARRQRSVSVAVLEGELCAPTLINSAPCPLGSISSTDTMNNSPCPLALTVTWQRSYN